MRDRVLSTHTAAAEKHFSALTIECVAHLEFKSKSLHRAIYTFLCFPLQHLTFTHTTHKTLFPHFLSSGSRGGKKTQSCPESIQTFHPAPKILSHSALMLSHPAESLLRHIHSFSAPCESNAEPPEWQRDPVMVRSSGPVGVKGRRGKVNFCCCQFLYITIYFHFPLFRVLLS